MPLSVYIYLYIWGLNSKWYNDVEFLNLRLVLYYDFTGKNIRRTGPLRLRDKRNPANP